MLFYSRFVRRGRRTEKKDTMELKRKKLDMPNGGWVDQSHFERTIEGGFLRWRHPQIVINHNTAELWLIGRTSLSDAFKFDGDGFATDEEGYEDIQFPHSTFSVEDFLGENSIGRKTFRKYERIAFGLTPYQRHKAAQMDAHRKQIATAALRIMQPGFSLPVESVYVKDGGPMSAEYRLVITLQGGVTKELNWAGSIARSAVQAGR